MPWSAYPPAVSSASMLSACSAPQIITVSRSGSTAAAASFDRCCRRTALTSGASSAIAWLSGAWSRASARRNSGVIAPEYYSLRFPRWARSLSASRTIARMPSAPSAPSGSPPGSGPSGATGRRPRGMSRWTLSGRPPRTGSTRAGSPPTRRGCRGAASRGPTVPGRCPAPASSSSLAKTSSCGTAPCAFRPHSPCPVVPVSQLACLARGCPSHVVP